MNRTPSRRRFRLIAVLFASCLLISGCGKNKLTKANFDQITNGMTLAEVEKLIGKGTKMESGDASNMAGQFGVDLGGIGAGAPVAAKNFDIYTWEKGDKRARVSFVDGKVIEKHGPDL